MQPAAVVVVCGVLATVACNGSGASEPVALVDGVQVRVDAIDNTFRAAEVTVAPGTEVVWTNKGRNAHNVVPVDDVTFGVDVDAFGPDATYGHRFTEPGEYAYYCSLHGTDTKGMVGAVVVRE